VPHEVLAIVPARGGSKGVPGKNLARVGGRTLVARAVDAALGATEVTDVLVSTDSPQIADAAQRAGAQVVNRPAPLATDLAASEDTLHHALDHWAGQHGNYPEIVVMVQATSPFTTSADIDAVVTAVLQGADSAFTAAPFHAFVWRQGAQGATGVNHDPSAPRQRRQDREPELIETGAAYALRTAGFARSGHRFFGTVAAVPTDPARALEIDDADDLARARALSPLLDHEGWPAEDQIDAVVTDFDGVHTDNRATIAPDGTELVTVNRGDGLGIERLRAAGVPLLILSKEVNPIVTVRAAKLQIPVLHAVEDKAAALRQWLADNNIDPARAAYVGNDLNDLPALALVGWPCAVADAQPAVLAAARVVLQTAGGAGAVRELAERVLAAKTTQPTQTTQSAQTTPPAQDA
jgi:YrbI family 3-deoxy-D-manno-octulosonate 8-phosphate phosphatase